MAIAISTLSNFKVICILQNAWGNIELPIVFAPNPGNKSAKTIRKVVGHGGFLFSNTTNKVAKVSSGKFPPDEKHFNNVLNFIETHKDHLEVILICGKQANDFCFNKFKERINNINLPIITMPHPAARDLRNKELRWASFYLKNCRILNSKRVEKMSSNLSGRIKLLIP